MTMPATYTGKLSHERTVPSESLIRELEARIDELVKENEQFTYIVSHDLQAPLRTITGFLELIERRYADKLDDAGKQYIDFALKGSGKLKTLVFDLLEISRLNTGDFSFEQTNLEEILNEVMEDLGGAIRETGIEIHYSGLPMIKGNRKLMHKLFYELLDNAMKFRKNDHPQVNITSEVFPGHTLIHVADNGIGIDPGFLEKVFIIFRKLNTDELRYPGSGKGLAICKKIATLHGWGIRATSAPGAGTDIIIKINQTEL